MGIMKQNGVEIVTFLLRRMLRNGAECMLMPVTDFTSIDLGLVPHFFLGKFVTWALHDHKKDEF